MALYGKAQIAVPGIPEFYIVFSDSAVIYVKTFAIVEIPSHIIVIEKQVHDKVTDEISCPIKGGGELLVIHIFCEINLHVLDSTVPDPASPREIKEYDKQNDAQSAPVIELIWSGHENGT
jgi:hypothetical protein